MKRPIELIVYEIVRDPQFSPLGERRYAWGPGGLWEDKPRRHRPYYVCSAGVEHKRWWSLHKPTGRVAADEKACAEHEVVEIESSQLRVR